MRNYVMAFAATISLALPVGAAQLGDDGLHKTPWMRDTFKDMREDLAEANAEGKRLLVIFEQRGCIYCTKMHEEVFPDPEITKLIEDNYFVVQMNLFGDVPVTDFDGTQLPEKDMAVRWGVMFTPTMMFLPEAVEEGAGAAEAAVVTMPGAFGKGTTSALLTWVKDHGYDSGEHFQKYLASRMTGN
ncbi:thioredoxin [Rhodobacter veldkampii DSM 11550]|uniref:Thioredoxin n=1 Tax=Phaeovulum veldkampii DSM 11550 TaxID=1185920 RepID=A0A2T4JGW9_9RHOB|nr:thioredoxin family protein [Phaeovulum veldkampii]MBK5947829.1 thioredoxin [Phaeovulum veldkampii DSM 11550]NCU19817.1 thioredoxin [Candidatus Falkowbacteria bacterium]PTE17078.1 thioredoxin [Phaeovulum veldkampii DSM 11550]TDQ64603.1 thioredoxin-related protein [Phaeovulum veldkampii DSM 11550]